MAGCRFSFHFLVFTFLSSDRCWGKLLDVEESFQDEQERQTIVDKWASWLVPDAVTRLFGGYIGDASSRSVEQSSSSHVAADLTKKNALVGFEGEEEPRAKTEGTAGKVPRSGTATTASIAPHSAIADGSRTLDFKTSMITDAKHGEALHNRMATATEIPSTVGGASTLRSSTDASISASASPVADTPPDLQNKVAAIAGRPALVVDKLSTVQIAGNASLSLQSLSAPSPLAVDVPASTVARASAEVLSATPNNAALPMAEKQGNVDESQLPLLWRSDVQTSNTSDERRM
eukprot:TRINITY_DN23589_c0_g1_i1.p1 TRINITY_DN23589_c0_g1~~TRINITY_DN23589_c0_g1_i1.p1  ORF type:complete len:312 (-),score=60.63 TRINITY_DN23589_c0_g1_i1:219-1088(-)